ncbi:MAG: SpoIIE family protein phosphatase [Desulfobulbaceae bacterium]|nr:SpoIIE family protein phosphatase [Desulfobulbaceae bacterium]
MQEYIKSNIKIPLEEIVVENKNLKNQLEDSQFAVRDLKKQLAAIKRTATKATTKHAETVDELGLAKLIINQCPVVLFRRKAGKTGEKPTLEYVSENLIRFGYNPEDFMEERIRFPDIVHQDDIERVKDEINRYVDDDVEEYTQYYRVITKDGNIRWVEDQTSVVRDDEGNKIHNQGILIDITERKLAEDKLKRSEEKFRRIVETAAEGFLLMDKAFRIVDTNDAYCRLLEYKREELLGKNLLDYLTNDFRSYMRANKEIILAQEFRELEGSAVAKGGRIIPILLHGNTLRGDQGSIIGNMAFITDMTEHKKALILAGEVQRSLLPQEKPIVNGLDIAGRNVSCDEIGGDYFDFLWRHESRKGAVSIVVGDISGHGVDSALLMTTARAFLRMRAAQPGSISEIISEMNNHLASDVLGTGRFMTLFYLAIDSEHRDLKWVRAGHDPALVYTPDTREFEELKGKGIALGVADDFEYMEHHKKGLKNGQIIAIGTDGIWEAFNNDGQMFGKKRLREIIQKHAESSAEDILSAVYAGLYTFMNGAKSADDITLVIIKVDGLQQNTAARFSSFQDDQEASFVGV